MTDEQQAVARWTHGPALVFAVAGAGKSSTLAQRALALLAQGYQPREIVMTTFSRDARQSLQDKLPAESGLQVMTLHGLAHQILREAQRQGLSQWNIGPEGFGRRLLEQARRELIGETDQAERELIAALRAVGPEDFETYLGVEKGALRLPTLPPETEELSAIAQVWAPEGPAAYRALYERHDELRRDRGWLDYDDSIVQAWALLAAHPQLRPAHWKQIMVDEFQDVSRAQAEMLDLVAQGSDCYMAIGDDDQTVYQWRGASPEMILDFPKRYGAAVFTLSVNWRCPADVVALSAAVIRGNRVRAPKEMRAATARCGVTIHTGDERAPGQLAAHLVRQGLPPESLAILVRTYAQTAAIEEVLIQEGLPYQITGQVPFYRRREAQTLMDYVTLATHDGQWSDPAESEDLRTRWSRVAHRPARYLRAADVTAVAHLNGSFSAALETHGRRLTGRQGFMGQNLERLALQIRWLSAQLDQDAGGALRSLITHLGYREYLIKSAPSREFGEERAAGAEALCRVCAGRPLRDVPRYLEELRAQAAAQQGARITLMSAFRAKGLEWPQVIVPGVSTDLYRPGRRGSEAEREEERRVLYVAMTRAREQLHLCYPPGAASGFLIGARHLELLEDHQTLANPKTSAARRKTIAAQYGHPAHLWSKRSKQEGPVSGPTAQRSNSKRT